MVNDVDVAYVNYLEKWISNLDSEINYWGYSLRYQALHPDIKAKIDKPVPFCYPNLLDNVVVGEEDIRVLDVGSGPFSKVGNVSNRVNIILFACDPLAFAYQLLLQKYNMSPPIIPEFALAERLSETYAENSFNIVCMNNALDHSYNPDIAVNELLRVVKIGGVVRLYHKVNEAEYEKYEGLHQWNISDEDGQFIIWNKSTKLNMSEILSEYANVTSQIETDVNGIKYVIQLITKTCDVPNSKIVRDSVFYETIFKLLLLHNSRFLCSTAIITGCERSYSTYVKKKYWSDLLSTPSWWLKRHLLSHDYFYNIIVKKIRPMTRGKQ